jgi:hypothetical protein
MTGPRPMNSTFDWYYSCGGKQPIPQFISQSYFACDDNGGQ